MTVQIENNDEKWPKKMSFKKWYVLLYHFLNDENFIQTFSPGKKKLTRPDVLKHEWIWERKQL